MVQLTEVRFVIYFVEILILRVKKNVFRWIFFYIPLLTKLLSQSLHCAMFSSCFEAVNEVNGGSNDDPDLIQRENAIQSQETNSEVVNIPNDSAYASFVNISTPLRNFSNVMRKQLSPRIKNVLVKK